VTAGTPPLEGNIDGKALSWATKMNVKTQKTRRKAE
jgi:hypothetical protein